MENSEQKAQAETEKAPKDATDKYLRARYKGPVKSDANGKPEGAK